MCYLCLTSPNANLLDHVTGQAQDDAPDTAMHHDPSVLAGAGIPTHSPTDATLGTADHDVPFTPHLLVDAEVVQLDPSFDAEADAHLFDGSDLVDTSYDVDSLDGGYFDPAALADPF